MQKSAPPQGTASSLWCRLPAANMQVGQKQNLKMLNPTDDSMKDKEKWVFGMQKLAPHNYLLWHCVWEGSPETIH